MGDSRDQIMEKSKEKTIVENMEKIAVHCTNSQSTPIIRRKRRRSAWEGQQCMVCGDRASGYHYNVLSCEGCKGFYRRIVTEENRVLMCKFGGDCKMDLYWRRKCPSCRLKKCTQVGMRPEFVTRTSAKPRVTSIPQKNVPSTSQSPTASSSNQASYLQNLSRERRLKLQSLRDIITREYQELCSVTSTSRVENLGTVADITTCHVEALVEFCKALPGFTDLPSIDQITMIKHSTIDASLLRSGFSFSQAPERQIDQSKRVSSLLPKSELYRPVKRFYDRISDLNPSETQIGLLVAISVFATDRADFIQNKDIESCQNEFVVRFIENQIF